MYFKRLLCIVVIGAIILTVASCVKPEEPTTETNATSKNELLTEEFGSEEKSSYETADLFEDVIHTTDYPTYAFVWSDNENKLSQESAEDEILSFIYTGEPIKLYTKLVVGGYAGGMQLGVLIYVNGILQTFVPSVAGSSYPGTTMFVMDFDAGEEKTVELQFQPNTGCVGEDLSLYCCIFQDPEYAVDASDETKGYAFHHDYGVSGPFALRMEADAKQQIETCNNYAGIKTESPNVLFKRLLDSYPDFGTARFKCIIKCGDFDTAIQEMDGAVVVFERIVAKSRETIDLCFYGHPGKYRTAFFVNNQLQTAFNGSSYLDFSVDEGMQTVISIPTDELHFLSGSNHCYLVIYGFDAPEELGFIKTVTHPVLYK